MPRPTRTIFNYRNPDLQPMLAATVPLLPLLKEEDVGIRCIDMYLFFNGYDTILAGGGEEELKQMSQLGGIGYTLPGMFRIGPVGQMLEQYSAWFKVINRRVRRCYIDKRQPTNLERQRIERIFEAFFISVALRHGDLCLAAYNRNAQKKVA